MSVLAEILDVVAEVIGAAAPSLSGTAGTVARIVSAYTELAADYAATGADPVAQIERIRSTDPLLADVERHWRDRIKDRFSGDGQ